MGWSIGWDEHWQRDIGYGVPAWCDHPDCSEEIDRGLSHVCGGEPYGGDNGCGLYFCGGHLFYSSRLKCFVCIRCLQGDPEPFAPKLDHLRWLGHKATDPSWAKWRAEQWQ